jgi:hypothetical protein
MGPLYIPGYSAQAFAKLAVDNSLGFMDEVNRYTVELPRKYLFETEELSQLAYGTVVAWQYLHAMAGDYSCNHPFSDHPRNLDRIADLMRSIGEREQAELLDSQRDVLAQFSASEVEAYLDRDFPLRHEMSERREQLGRAFFMNDWWYRNHAERIRKTTQKLATHLLENLEFTYVERGRWAQAVGPMIDSIEGYWNRLERQAEIYPTLVYPLFVIAKERLYFEYFAAYTPRPLGAKKIGIGKYLTSMGLRYHVVYSDGDRLVDEFGGIVAERNRDDCAHPLWSMAEAPEWVFDESTSSISERVAE